jgi:hypothetical protein
MGATDWVITLILGGILGMIGQGIRVIAGLKKVNDQASAVGMSFGTFFEGNKLALSLLIGFIAGTLAIIGVTSSMESIKPSRELIVTIIGAGYAGTDFIEGFIKKSLPAVHVDSQVTMKTDETDQPPVG